MSKQTTTDTPVLADEEIMARLDHYQAQLRILQEQRSRYAAEEIAAQRELDAAEAEAMKLFQTKDLDALRALLHERRIERTQKILAFGEAVESVKAAVAAVEQAANGGAL